MLSGIHRGEGQSESQALISTMWIVSAEAAIDVGRPQDPPYPGDPHKPIVPIDLLDDEQPRDHPHPQKHARQRKEDERDREDGVASAHGRLLRKCCGARQCEGFGVELTVSCCRQRSLGVKLAVIVLVYLVLQYSVMLYNLTSDLVELLWRISKAMSERSHDMTGCTVGHGE